MKKYIIWQDTNFMTDEQIKQWENDIRIMCEEEGEEVPEGYAMNERIEEDNFIFLDDERINLGAINLPESILCVADLGLWNRRVGGYREIEDLSEVLYSTVNGISYCEWYVDQYGNLRGTEAHHDGTNHYLYRMWKPETSDEQRENLLEKIYDGKATTADISRYTVRLGDYIGAIYGWKFSGKIPTCTRA